jgi:ABC-type microcin C transport system permease subunit YejB
LRLGIQQNHPPYNTHFDYSETFNLLKSIPFLSVMLRVVIGGCYQTTPSAVILSIVMLSVFILNVVMLIVMALGSYLDFLMVVTFSEKAQTGRHN